MAAAFVLRLRRARYFVIGGLTLILITYLAVYHRAAVVDRIAGTAKGMPPQQEGGGSSSSAAAPPPKKPGSISAAELLKEDPSPLRPSKAASQKLIADLPVAYGTTSRPGYAGLPSRPVADLPEELLPSASSPRNRLVVVGDVHGQLVALRRLLERLEFNASTDHLVLAGDMISKGPDSAGVVQLAMDLGASAVRGNHEDRVLLARREEEAAAAAKAKAANNSSSPSLLSLPASSSAAAGKKEKDRRGFGSWLASLFGASSSKGKGDATAATGPKPGTEAEVAVAAALSAAQLDWLAGLPVILRLGKFGGKTAAPWNAGAVAVVHAGLVPGVPLEKQDLRAAMNMRSLVYPAEALRRDLVSEQLDKEISARLDRTSQGRRVVGKVKVTKEQIDAELTRLEDDMGWDRKLDQRVGLPVDSNEGEPWSEAWSRYMNDKKKDRDRTVVVYGHDAKAGLKVERPEEPEPEPEKPEKADAWRPDIAGMVGEKKRRPERYAFGLDSGCVYGKQLTALVLAMGSDGGVGHSIVQVDCEKAAAIKH